MPWMLSWFWGVVVLEGIGEGTSARVKILVKSLALRARGIGSPRGFMSRMAWVERS